MGQKIHPLSLRIQSSYKNFDHAWYSDKFFSKLISHDISLFNYLNNFLKIFKLPSGRFSIYHLPNTTKLYSFFCYPKKSRESKSKIFHISTGLGSFKSKKFKSFSKDAITDFQIFDKILNHENQSHFSKYSKGKLFGFSAKYSVFQNYFHLSKNVSGNSIFLNKLGEVSPESFSNLFNRQFFGFLAKSFKTSEVPFSKKSTVQNSSNNFEILKVKTEDHQEILATFKDFLLLSKILNGQYNINSPISQTEFFSEDFKYATSLENNLSKFFHSNITYIPFQVDSEWQDAGYFADEIVFLLERRVSFRQIKNKLLKQFSLNPSIQGVRITCSGRVGGKSKKAQRAKVDSIKYGQTSLHIFSSQIDFAVRTAYTSLGSTGIKVWICYK